MLALFLGQETLVLATRELRDWKGWSHFCFIDYVKAFDCVDHNELWKILKGKSICPERKAHQKYNYSEGNFSLRGNH